MDPLGLEYSPTAITHVMIVISLERLPYVVSPNSAILVRTHGQLNGTIEFQLVLSHGVKESCRIQADISSVMSSKGPP